MAGNMLFNFGREKKTVKGQPEILFVVNPNAGNRSARTLLRKLEPYRAVVDVRIAAGAGQAAEIIHHEFDRYLVFVAAGGDGTVNEVASVLAGTNKKLAVYPSGSANGFAREFGFSRNIKHLMESIEHGAILKSDIIELNGNPSFHLSGVGFDGAVAQRFAKHKRHGFINYFISAVQVLLKFRPFEASVVCRNEKASGEFFMINIINNRQYGYHAVIHQEADPTDGSFDMVLVPPLSFLKFLLFSFKLFMGILEPSKDFKIINCTGEALLFTSENLIHIDGETCTFNSPLKITIKQGALNVIDTGKALFKGKTKKTGAGSQSLPKQLHHVFLL